jgi:hypothetical protein
MFTHIFYIERDYIYAQICKIYFAINLRGH